ncbi:DJ-1/PfpI family protein [Paenibacillus rhizophilus]|uniref:4-methyl-5(B-hydroxyethyl)-thiazole monophosphate biosynthesis protein n=2 Tax=Paenibacillus rhizophilus TaxID=1850366 RepID=A0A3N9P9C0_9BACL|nr:DJ-1/PfpI family protein [Paenibacillus rhizophilus]RQW12245.1 4-methyl-5(B-hydroxyethyl)-thiazole monophosphate biosynthesis protein [Paenibacillus rhizophilus]
MKTTGVIIFPLFSEYELSVALSVLKQGNHPITTIGITSDPIIGESDLKVITDSTIYNVDIDSLDSILLPGCMDITTLYDNNDLIDFIRRCADYNKELIIASISSSSYLLARAGLLEERKYTIGMYEEDRNQTGIFNKKNYCHDLVVQDGNVLTARGRGFIEFGNRLGQLLKLDFDLNWYLGD